MGFFFLKWGDSVNTLQAVSHCGSSPKSHSQNSGFDLILEAFKNQYPEVILFVFFCFIMAYNITTWV